MTEEGRGGAGALFSSPHLDALFSSPQLWKACGLRKVPLPPLPEHWQAIDLAARSSVHQSGLVSTGSKRRCAQRTAAAMAEPVFHQERPAFQDTMPTKRRLSGGSGPTSGQPQGQQSTSWGSAGLGAAGAVAEALPMEDRFTVKRRRSSMSRAPRASSLVLAAFQAMAGTQQVLQQPCLTVTAVAAAGATAAQAPGGVPAEAVPAAQMHGASTKAGLDLYSLLASSAKQLLGTAAAIPALDLSAPLSPKAPADDRQHAKHQQLQSRQQPLRQQHQQQPPLSLASASQKQLQLDQPPLTTLRTGATALQLNLHLNDTTAAAAAPVVPGMAVRAGSSNGVDSTPKAAATAVAQVSHTLVKAEPAAPDAATHQLQGTASTEACDIRVDPVMSAMQAPTSLQEGKLLVKTAAEGLESPAACGASSAASSAERLHIAGLTHDAQTPEGVPA